MAPAKPSPKAKTTAKRKAAAKPKRARKTARKAATPKASPPATPKAAPKAKPKPKAKAAAKPKATRKASAKAMPPPAPPPPPVETPDADGTVDAGWGFRRPVRDAQGRLVTQGHVPRAGHGEGRLSFGNREDLAQMIIGALFAQGRKGEAGGIEAMVDLRDSGDAGDRRMFWGLVKHVTPSKVEHGVSDDLGEILGAFWEDEPQEVIDDALDLLDDEEGPANLADCP